MIKRKKNYSFQCWGLLIVVYCTCLKLYMFYVPTINNSVAVLVFLTLRAIREWTSCHVIIHKHVHLTLELALFYFNSKVTQECFFILLIFFSFFLSVFEYIVSQLPFPVSSVFYRTVSKGSTFCYRSSCSQYCFLKHDLSSVVLP